MSKGTNKGALGCAVALAGLLALGAAGCAPRQQAVEATGAPTNDAAVKGEYTPYDPSVEAAATSGAAIEGSEEEQLQQERIAGGAAGAVQSQNLEPLTGVIDYSEGEYVPVYGIEEGAAEVVHGDANGTMCTTCHGEEPQGAATSMPQGHVGQNLTDDDCVTCHEI